MSKKLNFFTALLRPAGYSVAKLKFGYKYKKATDLPENYIVLSNHVTDYDPILVGLSFQRQMYYVASEHITRWGWLYKVLNFVFEPIIRYKATVAASTVMDILRKVRKGNNVCIFAEGVTRWRFVCIFAEGEDKGSAPSSRRRQRSSALHLTIRISSSENQKRKIPNGIFLFW